MRNTDKKLTFGRFTLRYRHRGPDTESQMIHGWQTGRFGGGWQWEVGVHASNLSRAKGSIALHLLVCSVTLSWKTINEGGQK